jgi:hypothetical protein
MKWWTTGKIGLFVKVEEGEVVRVESGTYVGLDLRVVSGELLASNYI